MDSAKIPNEQNGPSTSGIPQNSSVERPTAEELARYKQPKEFPPAKLQTSRGLPTIQSENPTASSSSTNVLPSNINFLSSSEQENVIERLPTAQASYDATSALPDDQSAIFTLVNSFSMSDVVKMSPENYTEYLLNGLKCAEHTANRNNRKCMFKNVGDICRKTRLEIEQRNFVSHNLYNRGYQHTIKDFIFALIRITNCWGILKIYKEGLENRTLINEIADKIFYPFIFCVPTWEKSSKRFSHSLFTLITNLDRLSSNENVFTSQYTTTSALNILRQRQEYLTREIQHFIQYVQNQAEEYLNTYVPPQPQQDFAPSSTGNVVLNCTAIGKSGRFGFKPKQDQVPPTGSERASIGAIKKTNSSFRPSEGNAGPSSSAQASRNFDYGRNSSEFCDSPRNFSPTGEIYTIPRSCKYPIQFRAEARNVFKHLEIVSENNNTVISSLIL